MSRIAEIIEQHCPDGAKSFKLGEICSVTKGKTAIQKAKPGGYPLVVTAKERKTSDAYQFNGPAVCIPLVSSKGHGIASLKQLHYQEGRFALGNILCAVQPNDPAQVSAKYLYHFLDHNRDLLIVPLMRGGANVALHPKSLLNVNVPIPPLEVQQEIVRILDTFTELEANLQRELDARKKQYEHYRDELIQELYANNVSCRQLRDITIAGKKGTLKQTELVLNGEYPVVNSGCDYYGYYSDYNNEGSCITIASRGEYAGFIRFENERFWAGGLCYPFIAKDVNELNPKYLFYLLKNKEGWIRHSLVARGSIPALNKKDIDSVLVPIPSLEVQRKIVAKLDVMIALQSSLQRQIDLTHKQYVYYRDKLLDFPKKVA